MSFTVVPLHNLNLPAGTRIINLDARQATLAAKHALVAEYEAEAIPFGNGFVLHDVPDWVKSEKSFLADNPWRYG